MRKMLRNTQKYRIALRWFSFLKPMLDVSFLFSTDHGTVVTATETSWQQWQRWQPRRTDDNFAFPHMYSASFGLGVSYRSLSVKIVLFTNLSWVFFQALKQSKWTINNSSINSSYRVAPSAVSTIPIILISFPRSWQCSSIFELKNSTSSLPST